MKTILYKCEGCGSEIKDSDKFCYGCGSRLMDNEEEDVSEKFIKKMDWQNYIKKAQTGLTTFYSGKNKIFLDKKAIISMIKSKNTVLAKEGDDLYIDVDGDNVILLQFDKGGYVQLHYYKKVKEFKEKGY